MFLFVFGSVTLFYKYLMCFKSHINSENVSRKLSLYFFSFQSQHFQDIGLHNVNTCHFHYRVLCYTMHFQIFQQIQWTRVIRSIQIKLPIYTLRSSLPTTPLVFIVVFIMLNNFVSCAASYSLKVKNATYDLCVIVCSGQQGEANRDRCFVKLMVNLFSVCFFF